MTGFHPKPDNERKYLLVMKLPGPDVTGTDSERELPTRGRRLNYPYIFPGDDKN